VNALWFAQKVGIGVRETAGAPVLLSNQFTGRIAKTGMEFSAPRVSFKNASLIAAPLDWSQVLASGNVIFAPAVMGDKYDAKPYVSRCVKYVTHIRNTVHGLSDFFDVGPQLAALRNEVLVWINDEKRRQAGLKCHTTPFIPPRRYCAFYFTTPGDWPDRTTLLVMDTAYPGRATTLFRDIGSTNIDTKYRHAGAREAINEITLDEWLARKRCRGWKSSWQDHRATDRVIRVQAPSHRYSERQENRWVYVQRRLVYSVGVNPTRTKVRVL
jgi:hypothetical protein